MGAHRWPALKEFPSHLVQMSDGPRAALDLELAEGSQYQWVSRALTGFREKGGMGGWKMTHQYAQSCRLAPGWQDLLHQLLFPPRSDTHWFILGTHQPGQ